MMAIIIAMMMGLSSGTKVTKNARLKKQNLKKI